MRKRISLFIIGSVLAIGAFLLYCYFTDASFLGGKGPPPLHVAIDPNRGIQVEQRSKTGELIYLFKAQKYDAPERSPNRPDRARTI